MFQHDIVRKQDVSSLMHLKMLYMAFVQTVVVMMELIHELHEGDEIENVDGVDTCSYHCEVIFFSTFPFTCESGIKIALPGKGSPFSWLKVFLGGWGW